MIRKITTILIASTILLTTSCASIVSKSNYPISINSVPEDANITITDKKGVEVFKGKTPASLKLKSSSGFFSKASYQVKFEKEGFDTKIVPLQCKLDGWYFGNILIGGLLGMLIIDPATGAMYKLESEFLNETLTQSTASVEKEGLKVYSLEEIPNEWKQHLVSLNK
ncbi:PEGA domain-containing protein [uncultured Tenacibaculum sp.]|uniref:PEGA domain-containing protein n=1 Tax=uncultured Tenacibaculum sp. TaxID=174713 RepID=UPI002616D779|nr:PEGA domain-containing protein [uncultured Tenacibaculum sp.]